MSIEILEVISSEISEDVYVVDYLSAMQDQPTEELDFS